MIARVKFKFREEIEQELKNDLKKIIDGEKKLNDDDAEKKLEKLLDWLTEAPKITTIRVNTLISNSDAVISHLANTIDSLPKISSYPGLPELIVVASQRDLEHEQRQLIIESENLTEEVIVDESCGTAVLRGSHIFAPGVMGLTSGAKTGDIVQVFADTSGKCRKGLAKKYEDEEKIFLGYGILKQDRSEIFCSDKSSGVAVLMQWTTSGIAQLSNESVPKNSGLLQNLPSIICSRILDPQDGEKILDMCAAPGNKTTHISALMKNTGSLVAMEKIKSKIKKLEENCCNFGCKNVKIFCFDATKSVSIEKNSFQREIIDGPPFERESFDRILVDGPCSGLGKRPQLYNKISVNELRSYVPLQRKIFSAAVQLLKKGGFLVYSTCTITVAENEGIVSWALKQFPDIKLISAREKFDNLGLDDFCVSPGYRVDGLSEAEANFLLRFDINCDTVGFFIALFKKN